MRVDIWDVPKVAETPVALDCGYPRDFEDHFTVDRGIGKGGFGLVRVVIEKSTGLEYACKSIRKTLDIPNLSPEKQAQHLDSIDREAKILKRLRGTLSVVHFKGAWEDDVDVHLVMEYCRGGELHHSIGMRTYTEGTVATYIRSVLHTLAQCHSHRILHRDIKPGNFMLLTEAEGAPLKAIDFGLAAFYDPEHLPRKDLGLDGTPWFMAPEVLNSQTFPASDLWSAGVMAYQLLSGYLPFDDVRNPNAPALSLIWKGILTEEPSLRRSAWQEVSAEAKDFIKVLLNKDHTQRPTAKDALKHPWLQTSFHAGKSRPLSSTVVQRIQRYSQTNLLRRTILELMATELLKLAPPRLSDLSFHGGGSGGGGGSSRSAAAVAAGPSAFTQASTSIATTPQDVDALSGSIGAGGTSSTSSQGGGLDDESGHGGGVFFMSPEVRESFLTTAAATASGGGGAPGTSPTRGRTIQNNNSIHQDAAAAAIMALSNSNPTTTSTRLSSMDGALPSSSSLPGGQTRMLSRSPSMQQIATLARAAARRGGGGGTRAATVHNPGDYWRIMRQASELAAIGSGHGQMNYLRVAPRTEDERQEQRKAARLSLDTSAHGGGRFAEFLAQLEDGGSVHLRHKLPSNSMRSSQSMGALMKQSDDGTAAPSSSAPFNTAYSGGGGGNRNREFLDGSSSSVAVRVNPATGDGDEKMDVDAAVSTTTTLPETVFPPSAVAEKHRNGAVDAIPMAKETTTSTFSSGGGDVVVPMDEDTETEKGGRGRSLAFLALQKQQQDKEEEEEKADFVGLAAPPSPFLPSSGEQPHVPPPVPSLGSGVRTVKRVTFNGGPETTTTATTTTTTRTTGKTSSSGAAQKIDIPKSDDKDGLLLKMGDRTDSHSGPVTNPQDLEALMRKLHFHHDRKLSKNALAEGLRHLGYELDPSEMAVLMDQLDLDDDEAVAPAEFVASQLDWGMMQRCNRDLWLECARRAFADLDSNSDGVLSAQELVASLRSKLPAEEVDFAVEDALVEAGGVDPEEIDFEGFLKMLHVGSFESLDSLDQYEARFHRSSLDGSMDASGHGGGGGALGLTARLETVPENLPPNK